MDELRDSAGRCPPPAGQDRRHAPLPAVTMAERAFWRRAVEAERRRRGCDRPAPFPFQPA